MRDFRWTLIKGMIVKFVLYLFYNTTTWQHYFFIMDFIGRVYLLLFFYYSTAGQAKRLQLVDGGKVIFWSVLEQSRQNLHRKKEQIKLNLSYVDIIDGVVEKVRDNHLIIVHIFSEKCATTFSRSKNSNNTSNKSSNEADIAAPASLDTSLDLIA